MSATPSVVLDSGTSFIMGPVAEVRAIAGMARATEVDGLYAVPCDGDMPDLAFAIGGRKYALAKEDLVVERSGDGCVLGLIGIPAEAMLPAWVLGALFMRKYYVQFDFGRERLGFALARHLGGGGRARRRG